MGFASRRHQVKPHSQDALPQPTWHRSLTWELRQGGPQQVHVILFTQVLTGQAAFCLYRLLPAGDWEVERERERRRARGMRSLGSQPPTPHASFPGYDLVGMPGKEHGLRTQTDSGVNPNQEC